MEGLCRSIGIIGCADKIAGNIRLTFLGGGKEEDSIQNKGEDELRS